MDETANLRGNRIAHLIAGVKLFDWDGPTKPLFDEWRELGINSVFAVSDRLAADRGFRQQAADQGIAVFIVAQLLMNQRALEANPELYAITDKGERAIEDWAHFVCPTRPEYRRARYDHFRRLVETQQPDGISLDFIRHFVFWEKLRADSPAERILESCFCDSCLQQFQADSGLHIPARLSGTAERAAWLRQEAHREFIEWKCRLISDWAADLASELKSIKPDLLVNIHTVPWLPGEYDDGLRRVAGQDLAAFAGFADYLSPMTYAGMLQRDPPWISQLVATQAKVAPGRLLPCIQLRPIGETEAAISDELFARYIDAALTPDSAGLLLFAWDWQQLAGEATKKAILQGRLAAAREARNNSTLG
ncbi:MAG: hypothetical protein KKI09_02590 [Spirochaetes bacterium]|nr:hypothetical protein [Spirochaetota bacterium]MBU0954293.1 hypothetical protein [Spirochaetota bacterium]